MNQIFGYQISPKETFLNDIVFEGTHPVLIPTDIDGDHRQAKLFVEPRTSLQSCFSRKYGAYCYVWGIPAHPEISLSDIPEWCISNIVEKRYDRFRELVGTFIAIIDEPKQNRLIFVNDILGIRPLFLGQKNGRLVFGSDVWTIHSTGLIDGAIDYDAVSAWIAYRFNCTDGSLFADLRRLPPGSVVIYQDGECTKTPYAEFKCNSQALTISQVAEDIHDIISSAVKTLLSGHPRVSVALSGGFDSRYLLALSLSLGKNVIDCATVRYTKEEGIIADKAAEILGVPLKEIPMSGLMWDLYDQVHHFMADGFPISKWVTHCVARRYPEMPMVNGFLGGPLMRGSGDTFLGKYETEWEGDLADVMQAWHSFNVQLFRKDIVRRIRERSRVPKEELARKWSNTGKVFILEDLYHTQRFYISNNFLQHIGITEALLPLYSWELIAYKVEHNYRIRGRDIYHKIFQNHFPEMDKIPHASDLSLSNKKPGTARCTRQWAKELIPALCGSRWLSLLSRRFCIPRNIAVIAGWNRGERAVFLFQRLYLLEKKVKDAGLDFDWERI